jgi:gluconokinase
LQLAVMGVSGSGKTTLGQALAAKLGWRFADADAFHPPANLRKMAAGRPLDDADRRPWLEAIAAWLQAHRDEPAVVTCSALKRAYRARLSGVRWVYLKVPREVLAARLGARTGHFFSPALLDSQLAALEEPAAEEGVLTLDGTRAPEALVDDAIRALNLAATGSASRHRPRTP